jgi:hypothetical protein
LGGQIDQYDIVAEFDDAMVRDHQFIVRFGAARKICNGPGTMMGGRSAGRRTRKSPALYRQIRPRRAPSHTLMTSLHRSSLNVVQPMQLTSFFVKMYAVMRKKTTDVSVRTRE